MSGRKKYKFEQLTRKGSAIKINSAARSIRAAAWFYASRHGFKVVTNFNDARSAIIVTRIT